MGRAILGGVELSVVTSEDISRSNNITSRPTEKEDVVDHVKADPFTVSITGFCVEPNAWESFQTLIKLFNEGTLTQYIHRNSISNVIIEKLDSSHHNRVDKGIQFSMTLKHIKIANSRYASNTTTLTALLGQMEKVNNVGSQPVRSR